MLMRRFASVMLVAELTLSACGVARADPRELELSRVHEGPSFAGVGGLSLYNPASSRAATSLQITAGIRYVKPYATDATYDFSGTQLTASRLSSGDERLASVEAGFYNFLPRTPLFTFDHHAFYGVGLGIAVVERSGSETLTLPLGTLCVGLQSRSRHFDIESSVKLVLGPRRREYDISGPVTQVALVYPLGF